LNTYNTDPNDADTDDGGINDGDEVAQGTNPTAGNGADDAIALNLKVMLQGAMYGGTPGLMRDDLRQQGLIPLAQPYSSQLSPRFTHVLGGSETTTNAVLAANAGTPDAIVDWVFVEIRDAADSTTVIATVSGLVQRDGDIIGADGGQLRVLNLPSQFFVAVKHRNHLGAMIAQPLTAVNGQASFDFTIATAEQLYNKEGYDNLEMTTFTGKRALWAGNGNADSKVKYDGPANDRNMTLANVLTHPNNTNLIFNFANATGYFQGDVNLDGKAKYDGGFNDRVIIQNSVLLYPLNATGNQLNNFDFMIEQLP